MSDGEHKFSGEIYKTVDRGNGRTRLHVAKYQPGRTDKEESRYVLGWFELPSSIAKHVYQWDHATIHAEDAQIGVPDILKSFSMAKTIAGGLEIVKTTPRHIAIHPQGQEQATYLAIDVSRMTVNFIGLDWLVPAAEISQEGVMISSGGELFRPHLRHNARSTLVNLATKMRRASELGKGPR